MNAKYKYDGALIEVINWANYNPRNDSKKPSWFRMNNNFLIDSKIFSLKCDQKLLWISILAQVSEQNGKEFSISFEILKFLTQISVARQNQTIELFEQLGLVRIVNLRGACESRTESHATDVTTNETNTQKEQTSKTESVSENFKTLKTCYQKLCGELWPENKPPNIDQQLEWLLRKTADVKIGVIVLNAVARKAQNPTDQWPIRKIFMFSTFKADSWNLIWDYAREYYADRITEEQIQKVMSR